jgi:hypothetical protein
MFSNLIGRKHGWAKKLIPTAVVSLIKPLLLISSFCPHVFCPTRLSPCDLGELAKLLSVQLTVLVGVESIKDGG